MRVIPRYLKRYRKFVSKNPTPEAFSGFLEQLDASDWSALIEALLVTRPPEVYEVIAPDPTMDLVPYAARLLEQGSPACMRHFANALELVLTRARRELENADAQQALLGGLRLMEMLNEFCHPDAAREILFDEGVPADIRVKAGFVLSGRDDSHIEWTNFDFRNEPYLLPPAVAGVSYINPEGAIHLMVATPRTPPNQEMLEYPLRLVIRKLSRNDNKSIIEVAELLETIPRRHWAREYIWKRILGLAEFSRLQARIAAKRARTGASVEQHPTVTRVEKALVRRAVAAARRVWVGITIDQWVHEANDDSLSERMELKVTTLTAEASSHAKPN